ncbi:hypothetical protein Q5424_00185 [Conexibacter sp. JD483]|uniref:hypothetical protein n=1 Tax=unclassified Conexibacter TaxID=2627773 RepID=UPI002728A4DD|nr:MULTISPECIES: hypothetical protein [unclassified Conexibacter]MDO8184218.1 hypothetical protein [Conexibacter sp. CPCC 205706]MDO8197210.1 hypothetical protein [Conexibacter sp. CPCC 205762]MDR9367475.1 hypothetical protein [Conexibacter sp. JD483]
MSRRLLPLALLAALVVAGCDSVEKADITPEQRAARVQLIRAADNFDDQDLARLCRGLYPSDFLTKPGDYPDEKKDHRAPSAADRDRLAGLVARAGCDVPAPMNK